MEQWTAARMREWRAKTKRAFRDVLMVCFCFSSFFFCTLRNERARARKRRRRQWCSFADDGKCCMLLSVVSRISRWIVDKKTRSRFWVGWIKNSNSTIKSLCVRQAKSELKLSRKCCVIKIWFHANEISKFLPKKHNHDVVKFCSVVRCYGGLIRFYACIRC